MNSSLPWRPASEIQPKTGETYLVAYDDASEGDPPFWCYLVGNVYPRDGALVIYPAMGDVDGQTLRWSEAVWAIPLDGAASPDATTVTRVGQAGVETGGFQNTEEW